MRVPEVLAQVVERIHTAGRAAYPDVVVSEAAITESMEARLRDDPGAQLDNLHDADLYLAIALAGGDKPALAIFESKLVPQIDVALRRLRLAGGTADEVKQALRFELLVGDRKISDYAGR